MRPDPFPFLGQGAPGFRHFSKLAPMVAHRTYDPEVSAAIEQEYKLSPGQLRTMLEVHRNLGEEHLDDADLMFHSLAVQMGRADGDRVVQVFGSNPEELRDQVALTFQYDDAREAHSQIPSSSSLKEDLKAILSGESYKVPDAVEDETLIYEDIFREEYTKGLRSRIAVAYQEHKDPGFRQRMEADYRTLDPETRAFYAERMLSTKLRSIHSGLGTEAEDGSRVERWDALSLHRQEGLLQDFAMQDVLDGVLDVDASERLLQEVRQQPSSAKLAPESWAAAIRGLNDRRNAIAGLQLRGIKDANLTAEREFLMRAAGVVLPHDVSLSESEGESHGSSGIRA